MSKYNAGVAEARGERTIGQASMDIGLALWELQARNTSHRANSKKTIVRTSSRKNYRVPLGLIEVLGLESVHKLDPLTEPPTALVPVQEMVKGLEAYAVSYKGHKMARAICSMLNQNAQESTAKSTDS